MKAARFHDHHDIRIEEVAAPTPEPGEVLVDVHWGGICGVNNPAIPHIRGPR